jgi:hypothetical protein
VRWRIAWWSVQYDRGDLLTSNKTRLSSSIPALGLSYARIYKRLSPAAQQPILIMAHSVEGMKALASHRHRDLTGTSLLELDSSVTIDHSRKVY